jgi:hypothetical protein
MMSGNKTLVDGVLYTLGSGWAPIPTESQTFTIFNDANNAVLTTDVFTPPEAPFVFTNFLIGMSNETQGSVFACRAIPLIDAPESL